MITVATMLWEPNGGSREFSRCYDERWVERFREIRPEHEGLQVSPWARQTGGAYAACVECDRVLIDHPDPRIVEVAALVHVRGEGHQVLVTRRQMRSISPEAQ